MNRLRSSIAGAVAALALSSFTLPASAQSQTGFAVDRFEPSERGSQFFVMDTLDIRGAARPALGAVLDYGYKPLVIYDRNGDEKSTIVRHQLFTHIGGSLVISDRLRLALNVPFALYQDGEGGTINGQTFKPADKPAIGDVRVAADLRLVGTTTDPITLAVGVRAWAPTGQRSQFTGDGSMRVAPQAMVAGDLGLIAYAARLALVYRARDDTYAGTPVGTELLGGAAVGIRAVERRLVIGPEIYATSTTDQFFKTRGTPAEWLFGLHYDVVKDLRIGAGVGGGLTRGYGAPEVRTVANLEWAPAYECSDRDKDGICDDDDACPDQFGDRDPDPKKNGCPKVVPPADQDGDGILDQDDACPTEPGIRTNDPATNGCPDRDGDGIVDKVDACVDVKGVPNADPKKHGCPPDRDGDGVYDFEDACVDVPGVRTNDPKTNGCPPDQDGDGVLDSEDACPTIPGPRNSDPKKNGCPLVYVTEKEIKITEQIKFKFDSAEILKESDGLLSTIKQIFEEHPEITKVRIEGHTDNVGKPEYNKGLSNRRAASVAKWLTDKGIKKERLESQGYGLEQPIDTNDTPEGRANNRRVQFNIVSKDESLKKPAPEKKPDAAPAPAPAPAPKP